MKTIKTSDYNVWIPIDKIIMIRRDSGGFPQLTTNPLAQSNRFNYQEDNWINIDEETFKLLTKD